MTLRLTVAMLVLANALEVLAQDFPQFRGPAGTGVVDKGDPPTDWSGGKGVAWRVALPGTGWSQPVVLGETVYVTAAVGEKLRRPKDMQAGVKDLASMPIPGLGSKAPDASVKWQVLALAIDSGDTKWTRTVAEGKPKFPIHPSNTYATETPCVDEQRVYVYFGATGTVAAFTHAGEPVWKTELGAFPHANGFGSGSSPALHDGKLFLNCFNDKNAFVVALDAQSGKEVWRQPRAKAGTSWASPLVWKNSKRTEIVACGDKLVTSHDPATGEELWRLGGIDTAFAPSPAARADLLILAASSPFSSSPMYAVNAGASGDITLKKGEKSNAGVAWFRTGTAVGMSSPVAAEGAVYFASQGFLTSYDISTGKQIYKERLGTSRMVTSSLLLVGEKLLVLDETGAAAWIKTGPAFERLGGGEIEDTFWASPALAGDRLFLRGIDRLYCLKK